MKWKRCWRHLVHWNPHTCLNQTQTTQPWLIWNKLNKTQSRGLGSTRTTILLYYRFSLLLLFFSHSYEIFILVQNLGMLLSQWYRHYEKCEGEKKRKIVFLNFTCSDVRKWFASSYFYSAGGGSRLCRCGTIWVEDNDQWGPLISCSSCKLKLFSEHSLSQSHISCHVLFSGGNDLEVKWWLIFNINSFKNAWC